MDKNIITVRDFNAPQTSRDRFSKQKISKATEVLNDTIYQLDLIDIYRTLPERLEYTFFPGTQGTFLIDHKLGHKTSLNKFKLKENISSIFSDNDGMNLGINYRK